VDQDVDEVRRRDRRDFLKRMAGRGAAVAAGAVVANGLLADGAGAANGDPINVGVTTTGTATTTLSGSTFTVSSGNDATNLASMRGIAGSATTIGVAGASAAGPQLRAEPNAITTPMPPTAGNWLAGSMMATTDPLDSTLHDLWYCYADGAGSSSGWFPLSLIPAFIPLPIPQRIYNSLDFGPPLVNTEERNIDATTGGHVPPTAFAVMFSLGLHQTVNNFGFVGVFPQNITPWPGNSNINWFGSNQYFATNVVTPISPSSQFTVHCGTNGSTHIVVDMLGYYTLTA
jgi:hypothetical protein